VHRYEPKYDSWLNDDGEPGIAFWGQQPNGAHSYYPAVWYDIKTQYECATLGCLIQKVMEACCKVYGCANGQPGIPSQPEVV